MHSALSSKSASNFPYLGKPIRTITVQLNTNISLHFCAIVQETQAAKVQANGNCGAQRNICQDV